MRVLTSDTRMQCPCGSNKLFDQCCGPYLDGAKSPPTAEALMRSRYTAYTRRDIDYIGRTFAPESQDFHPVAARQWAEEARWLGLEIVATERGKESDDSGTVEFVATYKQDGRTVEHHEISQFRKSADGEWRYLHGEMPPRERAQTVVRGAPKVGRNDPCPCGSGKKFKKCCG